MAFTPVANVDEILASSMETVESLVPPRDTGDSDPEWEKPDDDVAVARATLAHNLHAHDDEKVNSTLTSFTALEVDDTSMDLRLQEMEAAMARLLAKGSEMVVVTEDSQQPTDMVVQATHPEDRPVANMDTEPAASLKETVADMDTSGPEVSTPGDFVPEGGASDGPRGSGDSFKTRPSSALPAGTLEEKVFRIEGFPEDFPGIGKKSADLAQQLTQEEIASLFSKLRTENWTRPAVERVLEVDQIYKRQLAQEKMLPLTIVLAGGWDTAAWASWTLAAQVEGKCKLCQKSVIAVDKGPPSAEIKLGAYGRAVFSQGDQGLPPPAAALEITKKSSGPVDKDSRKLTEEQFLDHINPQLDVIVEMQAGAQSVEEAKGASILRQLDTEKLRSLLKRNYLQGPGNQGEEFITAQTTLEEAKASNKRMQEEGAQRSMLLRPVADSIDTWGTQLRAALEMNVFNPDSPLKDMELDDIEAMKDRYMNTKFLLNQSRNPFPASLPQELPSLAALQREGERVARDSGGGLSSTGAFGPEEQSPERIIELHMGEQRMIGGRWKKVQGPLAAPTWAKPLPEGEKLMLEMRTHPCSFKQPFFEPIALTKEEIDAQVAMGTRPPLDKIIGPFHAEGDGGTHWQKEVQTWDLVSLFSCFGHTYSARHLYAVWSHLPITIQSHKRGAKNKQQNLQRRDDHRLLMKEAKEFVILHDLPVPTTNQEWKQLYREMGSFFAAKVFINRTPQVVLDLPVAATPSSTCDCEPYVINGSPCP
ncbi:unnamed protein product [Symbiodinium sp. CCMP2592]|nr:unnamed protein product [Symbiodinium sp. CCMP2592]